MLIALYILAGLVLLLILFIFILALLGWMLPPTHTASIAVDLAKPRDEVWALLDDVQAFPRWLPGISKVEMLPARDGRRVFRQTQGRNSFVLEETVKRPPELVIRTITDDNAMFSGQWEHRLESLPGNRTRLTVAETGSVKHAIPRAMMRYLIGHRFYLNKFAAALRAACGS